MPVGWGSKCRPGGGNEIKTKTKMSYPEGFQVEIMGSIRDDLGDLGLGINEFLFSSDEVEQKFLDLFAPLCEWLRREVVSPADYREIGELEGPRGIGGRPALDGVEGWCYC